MVSKNELWTVVEQAIEAPEDGPWQFEPETGARKHSSRMATVLRCTSSSRVGLAFLVHGYMVTTWWENDQRVWRSPWSFAMDKRIEIVFDDVPTSDQVNMAGIAPLHRAVKSFYLNLARIEGSPYGPALSLPAPGQRGHSERYYAVQVETYLDFIDKHGRGYMKKLLQAYPGETKSGLLDKIKRAETRGLVVLHREPGKLTRGEMTERCRELLSSVSPTTDSDKGETQ